jgi:hypothetical protein
MTPDAKSILTGEIAKIAFVCGECTFVGIFIGDMITEHLVFNRLILIIAGLFFSALLFTISTVLKIIHLTKKEINKMEAVVIGSGIFAIVLACVGWWASRGSKAATPQV